MAWDDPFPPYLPPAVARKREKEARQQRDLAKKLQSVTLDPEAIQSGAKPLLPAKSGPIEGEIKPARRQLPQHYIMNLPDSALTFLGAFNGLYASLQAEPDFKEALDEAGLPLVHVYCFTRELEEDQAEKDICEVSHYQSGNKAKADGYSVQANTFVIPSLAPRQIITCISSVESRRTKTCTASLSVYRKKSLLERHRNNQVAKESAQRVKSAWRFAGADLRRSIRHRAAL